MKRFYMLVIGAFFICNGCQSPSPGIASHASESSFFTSFSFPDKVNISGATIKCPGSSSTFGIGDSHTPHRKVFYVSCQADQYSRSNWDQFISALRAQVEQELKNSGARIMAGGENKGDSDVGTDFHYDYQEGNNYGGVDVILQEGEPGKYYVTCVIREGRQMP